MDKSSIERICSGMVWISVTSSRMQLLVWVPSGRYKIFSPSCYAANFQTWNTHGKISKVLRCVATSHCLLISRIHMQALHNIWDLYPEIEGVQWNKEYATLLVYDHSGMTRHFEVTNGILCQKKSNWFYCCEAFLRNSSPVRVESYAWSSCFCSMQSN